jgi:hypothetical protein
MSLEVGNSGLKVLYMALTAISRFNYHKSPICSKWDFYDN